MYIKNIVPILKTKEKYVEKIITVKKQKKKTHKK